MSGFVSAVMPLGLIAVIVVAALALAALARGLTAGQGFYTEQWASGIIIVLGLLGSAATYAVSSVQSLRRVKGWQQAGQTAQANGALWGLVVVALVVLLPVVLAIVIPQHPAPNLAP
jgi:hypothetical protein